MNPVEKTSAANNENTSKPTTTESEPKNQPETTETEQKPENQPKPETETKKPDPPQETGISKNTFSKHVKSAQNLQKARKYKESYQSFEKLVQSAKDIFGEESEKLANMHLELANVMLKVEEERQYPLKTLANTTEQGIPKDPREQLEHARTILEKRLAKPGLEMIDELRNNLMLASVFWKMAEWASLTKSFSDAKEYIMKSISITRKVEDEKASSRLAEMHFFKARVLGWEAKEGYLEEARQCLSFAIVTIENLMKDERVGEEEKKKSKILLKMMQQKMQDFKDEMKEFKLQEEIQKQPLDIRNGISEIPSLEKEGNNIQIKKLTEKKETMSKKLQEPIKVDGKGTTTEDGNNKCIKKVQTSTS